ncbi:centromere protein Chl4/mis15/CENP-N [Xylariaceae sp. FL0255]|nr:centromere protein Chl4/mis15/CENP-N [Xylariaceae sp. FL0255]
MAPPLSLPITARLPSYLRVDPSNASITKSLNRLSRPSLLSVVLDWLDPKNLPLCRPILRRPLDEDVQDDDDEDDEFEGDLYPPLRSIAQLQELYTDMQARKGSRREVVDRILEGDWCQGLSLYQLAMIDQQYLYDHPGTLKWGCYKIQRLRTPAHEDDIRSGERDKGVDKKTLNVPRFHPSTFLQNLQAEVLPDVKAHYNFERPKGLPLLLLRIFVIDSPYNTDLAISSASGVSSSIARTVTGFDTSRTIYIAFPDASPHIFVSKSQSLGPTTGLETRSLRSLIVEGVPKALSRPRERYTLVPVNLQTKNLDAMLSLRGAGRTNAAGGGWSVYAKDKVADAMADSPLNAMLPTPPLSDDNATADENSGDSSEVNGEGTTRRKRTLDPEAAEEERQHKRARLVARARFGESAKMDDGKGIERLDVLIEDPFTAAVNGDQGAEEGEEEHDNERHARERKSRGRRSAVDISLLEETLSADEDEEEANDGAGDGHPDDQNTSRNRDQASNRRTETSGARDRDKWAWRPNVRLAMHGPHVFAGIRQLVEAGIIDGERMPGWMTGEEGVTMGAIRCGRVRGHRGSGL